MSIGRLPPNLPATPPVARPVDTARGAFFAAVKAAGAAAEGPRDMVPTAAPVKPQPAEGLDPTRILRPGSLVDIKV